MLSASGIITKTFSKTSQSTGPQKVKLKTPKKKEKQVRPTFL